MEKLELVKYEGNDKCIFALLKESDAEEYYLLYSKVNNLFLEHKRDSDYSDMCLNKGIVITQYSTTITIDLANGFKIVSLDSKKDYETIIAVVKELL